MTAKIQIISDYGEHKSPNTCTLSNTLFVKCSHLIFTLKIERCSYSIVYKPS